VTSKGDRERSDERPVANLGGHRYLSSNQVRARHFFRENKVQWDDFVEACTVREEYQPLCWRDFSSTHYPLEAEVKFCTSILNRKSHEGWLWPE
jgi:hypothetical protein